MLTSENNSLERQIFAYQRSMSVTNNIARLSLATTPSRLTPQQQQQQQQSQQQQSLTASPVAGYRHSIAIPETTIKTTSGYYGDTNSDIPGSYYDQREVQSSPQQQQSSNQYLQSQQQYYATFAMANNGSLSNPGSTRQSLSGPASPHHQPNMYMHQQHQTVANSPYSSNTYLSSSPYQLNPQEPMTYTMRNSSSAYRLASSPITPNPMVGAVMYGTSSASSASAGDNGGEDVGNENGRNASGQNVEDYSPYAGRYQLKA